MHLELTLHGAVQVDQIPELFHRKTRHFLIEEAGFRGIRWVCRNKVEEDAVFDREDSTVRVMFPALLLDNASLWEFKQPVDHLGAHPNGKLSGLAAIVITIVFSN